ncbi:hypothetical protein [Herbaspirillum sp. NPDC101396]|uniref:hypothetical protein n=1 Tax=Herbaspirillum sp. NPDC101396 TaxID=3364005 RepID=UPI00383AE650
MTNSEGDKIRAEITGLKAVLYSICAVQTQEQATLFHSLLQRQLDEIEANLSPSPDAAEFMQKTVSVIQGFMLFWKENVGIAGGRRRGRRGIRVQGQTGQHKKDATANRWMALANGN